MLTLLLIATIVTTYFVITSDDREAQLVPAKNITRSPRRR